MKIFGREPALIIGFVGAVLTYVVSLNVSFLSAGQAAALVTALTAVVTAFATRPVAPSLFVGAVGAIAALLAEYGLNWSDASVAGFSAMLVAGFALFGVRNQVTPAADKAPIAPASGSIR